jgi:hypothetical protein
LAKILEKEGLKVSVNVQGVPLTLARNGEAQRVTKVYKNWRVAEPEILRNYFTVKTSRGLVYDIYRDMPGGGWYLSKVYD